VVTEALPPFSRGPTGDGTSPLYRLILLGLLAIGGTLLLGLASAAPRLAPYWPEVFIPVARGRDAVSFFGLCLLASGAVAWVIVGTGI
jgi:hypothetical protein